MVQIHQKLFIISFSCSSIQESK